MVEVEGVAGIILAADAGCKAAAVELLGWDSIGGFTTVFFSGSVSNVAAAINTGAEAARQVTDQVGTAPLNQPEAACRHFVSFPARGQITQSKVALGLFETRGYGTHIVTNDRMVKAADVEVANVLTVQNRVVCSLIKGPVGAVQEALAVGKSMMEGSEDFLASALIAQPLPEVIQVFVSPAQGGGA